MRGGGWMCGGKGDLKGGEGCVGGGVWRRGEVWGESAVLEVHISRHNGNRIEGIPYIL